MSLGVAEIRSRAERLKSDLARERYRVKAGVEEHPSYARLYAGHDVLLGPEALPAVQRELAEASGEEQRRLRYLLAWVAEQQVAASVAPLEDEYRAWEAATRVRINGREAPFREMRRELRNEPDRATRLELEDRRLERMEEALPLQVDLLQRERQAVAELGFGEYVEARERLSGLNVRGLERQAVKVLTGTEDAYLEHLGYQARERLGVEPERLARADAEWLQRMAWLDDHFRLGPVLDGVRRDLETLGLPIQEGSRVRLDLEDRALKEPRSFCAPIRVPDEIVLVLSPSGGWPDCDSLMHELGHALHFAYTDASMPFEYRALGDGAVTEAYALLFELLSLERPWLERTAGLGGEALEEYLLLAGFLLLYRLRTQAARLLYEVELLDARDEEGMPERYEEMMTGATGFHHDPRTYLEEVQPGFWVARQLRGWMLRAILHGVLRDRYDRDWFRNPSAGPFLRELFSEGQREDASRLAAELGAERLSAALLVESTEGWLR